MGFALHFHDSYETPWSNDILRSASAVWSFLGLGYHMVVLWVGLTFWCWILGFGLEKLDRYSKAASV